MTRKGKRQFQVLTIVLFFLCFALFIPHGVTGAEEEAKEVALDFDDVDIRLFIRVISELTGKNFTVDNNVRGKVTVLSPKKLTTSQAYEVFKSVLNVNGFTVVEAGQVTKVIPAQNMSGYELPLITGKPVGGEDQFITQIMPLKHLDANGLVPLVKPMLSQKGAVFAPPSSDLMVVTDYKSNVRKVDKLLDEIDIEITDASVEKLDLKYSSAEVAGDKLTEILDAKYGKARKGTRSMFFKIVPLERNNALIGVASPDILIDIKGILSKIDSPTPEGKSMINVYYLENAKAEELVGILTSTQRSRVGGETARGMTTPTAATGTAARASSGAESIARTEAGGNVVGGKARFGGKDITITADKSTNSIVVYCDPDDYIAIRDMIQKLDIPRKQVYIEALIMEVSPDEAFNFGTEWQGLKDVGHTVSDHSGTGVIAGSKIASGALDSLAKDGTLNLGEGFSLGMVGEQISVGGFKFPSLSVLIKAVETLETVDILSKPQLMTLSNEKATINVSTNLPYQTTATMLEGGGTAQNYEYRDVGIKLDITPRINKRGKVTLEIKQEVSKLAGTVTDNRPTTLKRAIDTVVEVDDRGTIVIGGLIEEQRDFSTGAVPCLGGIPLFGWAFKTVGMSTKKSNLLVFISPRVFESSRDAESLTIEKKEYIENERNRRWEQSEKERPFFMEYDPRRKQEKQTETPK